MFLEKVYLGIEKQKKLHDTEANDNDGYLSHHGVKGMHWGIRRYQNPDGSLTNAGKLRYSVKSEADIVKSKATTKYLPFKTMPINKDTVKARGMLTDEEADKCISLANKLFDKASKEEPKITNDILDVVKKSNATMYGLDYRLKQPTSIAAKIGSDSKSDGISMEEAASGINDTIRYTVLANDKDFTNTYRSVQQSLTEKGYSERKCKNFFEGFKNGKVSHKAVQSSYQSPDGIIFEVQFQTPLSQAAKELKVPLYEEVRQASTSPSRREYLIGQMNALANNVSDPPDVFDIPSFSASSKVKHSGVFGERVLRPHDDETYLAHHGIKGQQWGVKNGPPYPIHRDAAYNTANDIYNKLDTFDYGCIIDGKRYNETNLDEVNWSKYRTTPVEDFEKTKIGTCWDYTNYQHEKLKEAGVDHTTRMIVMDTDIGPVTHTFTTFQDSTGQKYWLEQALYSERGIHPIEDYTDAVDVISKRYDSSKKRAFDVYEFNPDGMDKGLSDQEFFNRATSGDPIFQHKENTDSNIDISTKNWMRINEFYKSMSYKDRKLIDPDSTYEPENYFKSLDHYKKTTAYNFISDDGFLVAEKIPKNQNVDDTNGVEIGIGVKNKGKGVGTKMVSDLVDWFDNQNDIDTMWWPVDKSNKASIRVAEKNGFIKDPIGDNYIYAKDSAYKKLGIEQ